MKTFTPLVALSAVALLLTSCQAPATLPTPEAAVPLDAPIVATLTEGGAPLPPLRELDVVALESAVSAPVSMAIHYRRGMNEQVSWNGTGRGMAELKNEHGQLIYQVREGAEPLSVTVPAGRYTLTVTPDASQPASPMLINAIPLETGDGLTRRMTDIEEAAEQDRTARGPQDTCQYIRDKLKLLADLERALQFARQKARYHPHLDSWDRPRLYEEYMTARYYLRNVYGDYRGEIRERCEELRQHEPAHLGGTITAFVAPYLVTYYMDRF